GDASRGNGDRDLLPGRTAVAAVPERRRLRGLGARAIPGTSTRSGNELQDRLRLRGTGRRRPGRALVAAVHGRTPRGRREELAGAAPRGGEAQPRVTRPPRELPVASAVNAAEDPRDRFAGSIIR